MVGGFAQVHSPTAVLTLALDTLPVQALSLLLFSLNKLEASQEPRAASGGLHLLVMLSLIQASQAEAVIIIKKR